MIWPFIDRAVVTQRHGDARASGAHRAWDVAAPMHSTIHAPEQGELVYFVLNRVGEADPLWPRGKWIERARDILPRGLRAYPWYFADRVGHCIVLKADDRWWLFAHVDPRSWWLAIDRFGGFAKYNEAHGSGVPPGWKVEIHHTDSEVPPISVGAGELIGAIGNGGVSTGPHCHWECAPLGYAGGAPSRIDIATLFPDR